MRHMKPVTAVLLLTIITFHNATATKVIACNCSQPVIVGAMDLREITECNEAAAAKKPVKVSYAIISTKPGTKKFTGYTCTRIRKELVVEGNFWIGSFSKDRYQYEEHVSSEECWYMKQSKTCNEKKMSQLEGSTSYWSYEEAPDGPGYWYTNVTYTETNCFLEQVTLLKECDECPVISPYGQVGNASEGSIVLNHVTMVWEDSKASHENNCTMKAIVTGYGELYENNGRLPLRLKDRALQLDFLLSAPREPPCTWPDKSEEGIMHEVDDGKTLFAILHYLSESTNSKNKSELPMKIDAKLMDFEEKLGAHLQNREDEAIERENILASEINELDCKMKENLRNNIVTSAQTSGITAGRILKLPMCQMVQASLASIVILQCEKLIINITAEKTHCGYQPKYGDYSIASDGWRLTPYSRCTSTTPFVNLNDVLHRYENGTWIPIEPSIKLPHHKLVTSFNFTVDNAVKWIPQRTENVDYSALDHTLILTDMVALLQHNKIRRISELTNGSFNGQWLKKLAEWSPLRSVWAWFWRIIYMAAAIATTYVIVKVCVMTNGCTCCKHRRGNRQTTSLESRELTTIPSQPQRRRRSRSRKQYENVEAEIV